MSKITALATMKGGVGKSMLAVQIATTLATEHNKKILFIDVDPQTNSTNYFGVDEFEEGYKGFRDALENNLNPEECVRKTNIEGVDILGSDIYVTALDFKLFQMPARETRLKTYIENHKEFFDKYDAILMDTNPSMSLINQNTFAACDNIILVATPSMGSAKGLDLFSELWSGIATALGMDNKIKAIALNMVTERTNITKHFREYINASEYANITLDNYITESTVFKNAEASANPLEILKNKRYGSQIKNMVNELIEREVL